MNQNHQHAFDELRGRHILVLGDLILDRYTWGNAERVSPEAPVLVLRSDEHEVRPGGAASVALLLRHLDARVSLAGVVGDDAAGQTLLKVLRDESVDLDLVSTVAGRPTTTKERFIGRAANRHPHQILRVDHETRDAISAATVASLRSGIEKQMAEHSAVLISDYAKGVCTSELLAETINTARSHRIPVVVDPAKTDSYARYRRATLVTPNRHEAELATGLEVRTPEDAMDAGRQLVDTLSLDGAFVTMDRDGIAAVERNSGDSLVVPADTREVYDITGAGDMVLAITGVCQAAGWSLPETARLANVAAGLEIEQLGIAPITWQQIVDGWGQLGQRVTQGHRRVAKSHALSAKVTSISQLVNQLASDKLDDRSIVFTNGCFDLLHAGHVTFLQQAATFGDVLIVAINSDESVQRLKGPQRPIISQTDRATMLASLACVDYVLVFDDDTPHRLLGLLRPDILVKGGTTSDVVGREVVEAYGGQVVTTDAVDGHATTQIIEAIERKTRIIETVSEVDS